METAALKSFATWARTELIREVSARIAVVLAPGSPERVEQPNTVAALEKAVGAAGGGAGRAAPPLPRRLPHAPGRVVRHPGRMGQHRGRAPRHGARPPLQYAPRKNSVTLRITGAPRLAYTPSCGPQRTLNHRDRPPGQHVYTSRSDSSSPWPSRPGPTGRKRARWRFLNQPVG